MRTILVLFDRVVNALSTAAAIFAAGALLTISVSVIWEVIARSVLGEPTIWAVEVSTYAISLAGFMAAAYVFRRNGHLEITLFTSRLSDAGQRVLGITTDFLAALFCFVVVVYGLKFVSVSYLIGATSVSELRIELWIPQLCIPVGFGLLGLEFVCRILVRANLISREITSAELNFHD